MAALVMLVLLVCACSLFCELFQRRLEEVVPLAACAIVLMMYAFALAGLLRAGALAALGLCAACLPAALVLAAKRRGLRALLGRLLTPAALIYVLLCLASLVANAGKPVHTWDEFTYWADAVKIMTLQGVLPADAAARSLFASYPPALPLWQYLAQTVNGLLGGGFDEGLLFTSYQCLMLAFFMPFLRGARLRRPLEWLALAAGVPLCVLAAFPRGLDLLHADMMVGVLGGFACAWPLLFSVRDRFSLLTLCASLAALTLCKDAGLLYALAGVAAAYACLRTQGSEPALARGNAARRALWPLACVAAARLTWSAYATVMGAAAQATFSDPVSLSVLLSPEGAWRRTTMRNFLYKFFEAIVPVGDSDMSISYFLAFVLIGAGFALLYGAVRESKQALRLRRTAWVVFAATALYIAGTGLTYVFKFYEDEAVRMASYERYLSIAVLAAGFVLFACAACLRRPQTQGGMGRRASALALAALLAVSPVESALNAVTRLDAQAAMQKQAVYLDAEARVRKLCETGRERIYVLAPGSGGFEYQVMRYRLRPLVVLDAPWNPVDDPAAEDRFTACLSPEELMEELLESDLVLVFGSTEAFAETYGLLFAQLPQEDGVQIYRVDRENRLLVAAW